MQIINGHGCVIILDVIVYRRCLCAESQMMLQQQQQRQSGGHSSLAPPPVPQAPVITHTAATPQDSPNATLETGAIGLHRLNPNISLYASSLSIDSIDRSSVSICTLVLFLRGLSHRRKFSFHVQRIQRLWENRLHFVRINVGRPSIKKQSFYLASAQCCLNGYWLITFEK